MLVLEALLDHAQFSRWTATEFVFLFNEQDPERFVSLQEAVDGLSARWSPWPQNVAVGAENKGFSELAEGMLSSVKTGLVRLFVFVDPFGYKDAPMELIGRLLQYDKAELFIYFDFNSVAARSGCRLGTGPPRGSAASGVTPRSPSASCSNVNPLAARRALNTARSRAGSGSRRATPTHHAQRVRNTAQALVLSVQGLQPLPQTPGRRSHPCARRPLVCNRSVARLAAGTTGRLELLRLPHRTCARAPRSRRNQDPRSAILGR